MHQFEKGFLAPGKSAETITDFILWKAHSDFSKWNLAGPMTSDVTKQFIEFVKKNTFTIKSFPSIDDFLASTKMDVQLEHHA